MLSSRAMASIAGQLSACSQIAMDAESNQENIKTFIEYELQKPAYDSLTQILREGIRRTILEMSNGSFLWANLVLRELANAYTAADVEQQLHSLPKGLDQVYTSTLLQISSKHGPRALKILTWIVMARRPLSLAELGVAILDNLSKVTTLSKSEIVIQEPPNTRSLGMIEC